MWLFTENKVDKPYKLNYIDFKRSEYLSDNYLNVSKCYLKLFVQRIVILLLYVQISIIHEWVTCFLS